MHCKCFFQVEQVLGGTKGEGGIKMILVVKPNFLTYKFYVVKIIFSVFLNVFQNSPKIHHNRFFQNTKKKLFCIFEIQKKFMVSFCECFAKLQFYHVNFL